MRSIMGKKYTIDNDRHFETINFNTGHSIKSE